MKTWAKRGICIQRAACAETDATAHPQQGCQQCQTSMCKDSCGEHNKHMLRVHKLRNTYVTGNYVRTTRNTYVTCCMYILTCILFVYDVYGHMRTWAISNASPVGEPHSSSHSAQLHQQEPGHQNGEAQLASHGIHIHHQHLERHLACM